MQEFLREVNPRPSPRPHPTCSKITSNKPIVPDLSFAGSFKESSLINQSSSDIICQNHINSYELVPENSTLPNMRKVTDQTDKGVEGKEKSIDKSSPDAQLPMIIERVQKILKNVERRQQELQDCRLTATVDKLSFLNETDAASTLEQLSSQSFKMTGKLAQTDHTKSFPGDKTNLKLNMEKVSQLNTTPYSFDPNVSSLLQDNKVFPSSFEVKICPMQTVISNENFDYPLKSSFSQINGELAVKKCISLENFGQIHLPSTSASPDLGSSCCKCSINNHCDSGHPLSLTSEQIYSQAETIDNDQFPLAYNCNVDMAKKMKSSSELKTVSTNSLADENLTLGDTELNSVNESCESSSCTIHVDLKEYPDSMLCSCSEHYPYSAVRSVMKETKDSENKDFTSRERMHSKHRSLINHATSSQNTLLEESFLTNSTKVRQEERNIQISNTFYSNDVFLDSIIGLHPRHLMYNHLEFNHYQSMSDVNFSLQLNHLAEKYLMQETLNTRVSKTVPVFDDLPETTLSFASKQYLKKHKLLNSAIIPTIYTNHQEQYINKNYGDPFSEQMKDVYSTNRILNIEHLKQQPKLL